ncbi:predicted protein [Histoplasma capsulatum var. duboisii H88]|uniref:Predicted protein n=2 Tax=Ajellomyces capsulatus TaxID=5037 RepID=F0U6E7_AJEC8|nr:predicted protein [Histoplasma capsulatum H143]EGC41483.1 predicted protein [Histoplasma capsulatum var. duboisii H88]
MSLDSSRNMRKSNTWAANCCAFSLPLCSSLKIRRITRRSQQRNNNNDGDSAMGVFEQSSCIIVLIVDLVEVESTLSCDGPEFDSLASDSGLAMILESWSGTQRVLRSGTNHQ